MLEVAREGDQFVVVGDLAFAEQCAGSAYDLASDSAAHLRAQAEARFDEVQRLQELIEEGPDRIVVRPRYGRFGWPRANPGASAT